MSDIARQKTRLPPDIIDSMVKIAQTDFEQIVPTGLEETVEEKSDGVNTHVSKHHLIEPFPNDLVQIDSSLQEKLLPPPEVVIEPPHSSLLVLHH